MFTARAEFELYSSKALLFTPKLIRENSGWVNGMRRFTDLFIKIIYLKASKMAQRRKVFAVKPDDMSSIPGTHMVKRAKPLNPFLISTSVYQEPTP